MSETRIERASIMNKKELNLIAYKEALKITKIIGQKVKDQTSKKSFFEIKNTDFKKVSFLNYDDFIFTTSSGSTPIFSGNAKTPKQL